MTLKNYFAVFSHFQIGARVLVHLPRDRKIVIRANLSRPIFESVVEVSSITIDATIFVPHVLVHFPSFCFPLPPPLDLLKIDLEINLIMLCSLYSAQFILKQTLVTG